MSCPCAQHDSLILRLDAIAARTRLAARLRAALVARATLPEKRLTYYRCAACGASWQGAREKIALFGKDECLYQVPEISVEEWREEPYVHPAELVIYADAMRRFFAEHAMVESDHRCAAAGCSARATRGAASCVHHHARTLQRIGVLPRAPEGRLCSFGPRGNVDRDGRDAHLPRADAEHLEPLRPLA